MADPTRLRCERLFDGDSFLDDATVTLANGRIERVESGAGNAGEAEALGSGTLAPGFIDLQVNGGGGVLFNNDPSGSALKRMIDAHRRGGTTSFLPTLISDSPKVQRKGVAAVSKMIAANEHGLLGIHLEGPHLDRGRRGVHREEFVRPIGDDDLEWLAEVAGAMTVIVTLAPEHVPPHEIEALADAGVIVCAGHTNAGYKVASDAAAHGLRGFTHLYNAMSQLGSREPGVVGAALDLDDCWCGIIVDGHHVSAPSVRIAHRAKPAGKLYLVSDAMATAGTAATSYELYGEVVEVVDGGLRDRDGRIAGSAIRLIDAVRVSHLEVGLALEECLRMASLYPAEFIGSADRLGRIREGYRADLVLFDADFAVQGAWVAGERVVDRQA
jgi:N-acetylglucosamine-6-phosphate deacetylase